MITYLQQFKLKIYVFMEIQLFTSLNIEKVYLPVEFPGKKGILPKKLKINKKKKILN
jgi:hypothetical protein